jgi:hypothetical protein
MELLCPQCQQRLTIPDQYAGQVMRCPLCNGTFTAPTLTAAAPPEVPPPPPPVLSTIPPLEIAPSAPPPERPRPGRDTGLKLGAPPAPPPPPPGNYTRSFKMTVNPKVLPWIAPGGLFLVLILSIFPWFPAVSLDIDSLTIRSGNAWSFFDALIGLFLILLLLSLIAAVASALVTLQLVPAPPFIQALGPWRFVIVGGITLLGFLFFLMRYLHVLFAAIGATVWFRLAFCIDLVAVLALALEVWLEFRRLKNLPLPRVEVHW